MKIVIDYEPTVDELRMAALKAHRSAIRAKYATLADHEIKRTVAQVKAQFDDAIAAGKPLELEAGRVFNEYSGDFTGDAS